MIAQNKLILIALVLSLSVVYALPGRERHGLPGGLSDEMSADDGTRALLKKVDSDIRKQYPGEIESIEPISYRTQIVAGMNFFIKAVITEKGGKKSHAHIRIWKRFNGVHELTAMRSGLSEDTELKYFP